MEKLKSKIDVYINNEVYTIVGYESEEYIKKVSNYIDLKHEEIKKKSFGCKIK